MKIGLLPVFWLGLAATASHATAADSVIGVNFTGANATGTPMPLSASEEAGVVSQVNWNNFSEYSVPSFPLRDSVGNLTAVNISYTTGEMWGSGAYDEFFGVTNGNARLFNGYLNARTDLDRTNVITLRGLTPGAPYSVIAYTLRDNPGAQAAYWVNDNTNAALHILTESGFDWVNNPEFRRATNTIVDEFGFVFDDFANYGNYVRWDNVSPLADGTLSISVASETNASGALERGPINGIQLISSTPFAANTQTPQFVLTPRDVRVRLGQAGTFRATVDGPWSFQWFSNSVAIAGGTNSSFTTAPITRIEDTRVDYKLVVSNGSRTNASGSVNLILVAELPAGGIFYDGFAYPEGPLGNWGEWNETNPDAILTGPGTARVSSSGLSYTDEGGRSLAVSGGALVPPREPSGWNSPSYLPIKAFETLQGGPVTTIFMSFLFDFQNRTGGGIGFSGFEKIGSTPLDWSHERFWVGTRGGGLRFDSGLPNSPNSEVPTATNGFVVVRLTQDEFTVTADMYFNPPLDALPETPTYSSTRDGSVIFNNVGVNAGDWSKVDPAGPDPLIDEFRFGTTYASVTPTAESRPTLAVGLSGNNIGVTWGPNTAAVVLEMTDNLSSGTWTAAPAGNPVEIPRSGVARFFRLKK